MNVIVNSLLFLFFGFFSFFAFLSLQVILDHGHSVDSKKKRFQMSKKGVRVRSFYQVVGKTSAASVQTCKDYFHFPCSCNETATDVSKLFHDRPWKLCYFKANVRNFSWINIATTFQTSVVTTTIIFGTNVLNVATLF